MTATATTLPLAPGQYRLFLDQFVPLPAGLNPTPVEEPNGPIGALEVYPNPVQDRFAAVFSLSGDSYIQLEVYDLAGRRVAVPWSGGLPAGDQQILVDAGNWPSGMYWLIATDGRGARLTRKVVKFGR